MSAATSTQQLIVTRTMLKSLLVQFNQQDLLLPFLPVAVAEKLRGWPIPQQFSLNDLLDAKNWLKSIHYSWIASYLQQLPPQLLPSYLGLFPPATKKALTDSLKSSITASSPSPCTQFFLLSLLKKTMDMGTILPLPLLPPSPLNVLFSLQENSLLVLIDYLGLHDLAAETKQVVDKHLLGKIESALTAPERNFLAYCTKQAMLWVPPKLNLKNWEGDRQTLHALLHARGLARLAKATSTQDPHFRWHFTHRLDTSRGKVLIDAYKKPVERTLLPYFQKQVLELLERLKP